MKKIKIKRKKSAISVKLIMLITIIALLFISTGYALSTITLTITGNTIGSLTKSYSLTSAGSSNITIKNSGWYAIQAWGGDGGGTGQAYLGFNQSQHSDEARTLAAIYTDNGGYVDGYMYIEENTVLSCTVGAVGTTGSGISDTVRSNYRRFVSTQRWISWRTDNNKY